jgi:uncharacterized damage-inducible protein DinB
VNLKAWIDRELLSSQEFFERSARVLCEEHSGFAPSVGLYTVAQHVAHVAAVIDWFVDGTFSVSGFSMDHDGIERSVRAVVSLTEARSKVATAYERARREFAAQPLAALEEEFPEGSLMRGAKWIAIPAMMEHTAHHRGALTVYSRLLGLAPKMPYGEF